MQLVLRSSGLAGLVALLFVRKQRRVLTVVLLLDAAVLFAALVLVGLDEATYEEHITENVTGSTSMSTDHVWYLFVLWGLPFEVLLAQAYRAWGEGHRSWSRAKGARILLGLAAVVLPSAGVAAAYGAGYSPRGMVRETVPPAGVLVCRNAFRAPEVLGGWQCPVATDIGTAPIDPPQSLMCSSNLSGVKGKAIGVRLFYGGELVKDGNFQSSDGETNAYAVVSRGDIGGLSPTGLLPPGHYRCRFLVNGTLVHARAFVVRSVVAQPPLRYHIPREVKRISAIPGAGFDPSSADAIARRADYSAWVALADEHVADVAVWPTLSDAKEAVKRYQAGGPDTRSAPETAWPHVLLRVERIRNVTLAWYTQPSNEDEAAFRRSLRVSSGGSREHDYTSMWAIPGVLVDQNVTPDGASFRARLILAGGCDASGCGAEGGGCVPGPLGNDLYLEIWPSESAAASALKQVQDVNNAVGDQSQLERVRNALIEWHCHPTSADEALVKNSLHW